MHNRKIYLFCKILRFVSLLFDVLIFSGDEGWLTKCQIQRDVVQAWVQVGESGKEENIELFELPDKYISTNNMECASLVAKHI